MNHRHTDTITHVARLTTIAAVVGALVGVTAASASAASRRPITLAGHFTRVSADRVIGGQNRVIVWNGRSAASTLIDGGTGRHTRVAIPGCPRPVVLSATTAAYSCGGGSSAPAYASYDEASGHVVRFALPALNQLTAIGAHWAGVAQVCQVYCFPTGFSLQSPTTAETREDPTTSDVAPDLDAANPAQVVCSPVRVPGDRFGGYGSLTADGRYRIAVARGSTGRGGVYLEKCGSTLRRFLTWTTYPGCLHASCAPPASVHLIVWEAKPGQLSGLFLPSLRSFTLRLPHRVDPAAARERRVEGHQVELAVTTHTLYVGAGGRVWTTPLPTAPPRISR
jgi:hypothetical protein